jgi:peroxidase
LRGKEDKAVTCTLEDGSLGACCIPLLPVVYSSENKVEDELKTFTDTRFSTVTPEQLERARFLSQNVSKALLEREAQLLAAGLVAEEKTPGYYHHRYTAFDPETLKMGHKALEEIEMTRELTKMVDNWDPENYPEPKGNEGIVDVYQNPRDPLGCAQNFNSKYRTIDGSCNNEQSPHWGMSRTPFERLLRPTYDDGVYAPRTRSVTRRATLPSARLISSTVSEDINNPDRNFNLFVMQWGQFMDHDFTKFGVFKFENGRGIQCCRNGNFITPAPHTACNPIPIPDNDPFYSNYDQKCMEFIRALPAPRIGGGPGFVNHLNHLTAWIDGSTVYGNNNEVASFLRLGRNGQLKISGSENRVRSYMPRFQYPNEDPCTAGGESVSCFIGGDERRINEQIGLTLMHTMWLREHNRLAAELQTRNPHWEDEKVYQEARRIVIAEIQHITYNEWLNLIVGPARMTRHNLYPAQSGFSTAYNDQINPGVLTEVSTAAFRFGHSLIQGFFHIFEQGATNSRDSVQLREIFDDLSMFNKPDDLNGILRGLSRSPMQVFDPFVTEELTNHLFQKKGNEFGLDLVSLNIQRGREQGTPTYNQIRQQVCGLRKATSFADLSREIPQQTIQKLQSVYAHVDDIDLFIGGISETAVPNGILGPTFSCLVANQFDRFKRGDRYFYDLGDQVGSFTAAQLNEIRKVSLARIVCDNSEVNEIQPFAFKLPKGANARVPCSSSSIPSMNLNPWRETVSDWRL